MINRYLTECGSIVKLVVLMVSVGHDPAHHYSRQCLWYQALFSAYLMISVRFGSCLMTHRKFPHKSLE